MRGFVIVRPVPVAPAFSSVYHITSSDAGDNTAPQGAASSSRIVDVHTRARGRTLILQPNIDYATVYTHYNIL